MEKTGARTETAYEFLLRKGISKVHQPYKRYNLTVAELVDFLNEYAEMTTQEEYQPAGYFTDSINYRFSANNDIVI